MIAIIIGMRSPTFSTLYIACLRKSCILKPILFNSIGNFSGGIGSKDEDFSFVGNAVDVLKVLLCEVHRLAGSRVSKNIEIALPQI